MIVMYVQVKQEDPVGYAERGKVGYSLVYDSSPAIKCLLLDSPFRIN